MVMKPLKISDAPTMILGLQDEIRRSGESRYDHRLHGVLLVAHGISCREAAGVLGDSPRTVENWVHRFEASGLAGLTDADRPGRPSRLSPTQLAAVERALRQSPRAAGVAGIDKEDDFAGAKNIRRKVADGRPINFET